MHACAGRRSRAGERGEVGKEDNWVLEAELTFGSCSTGENLMRTKICLPNSPKKSLKHFVIPKCLENELVALQEPFCASSAVCSSPSSPCQGMLRAGANPLAQSTAEPTAGSGEGAPSPSPTAPHSALAPAQPTQASGLPCASVSRLERCPAWEVRPDTALRWGKAAAGGSLRAGARPFRLTYRQIDNWG